jgi:uncharacterized protein YuzE
MRVSYDPEADAAYIYLTDEDLMPGRDSIPCETPPGQDAMVVLDWKDGKIVGLEVLDASALLHADLLAQAGSGITAARRASRFRAIVVDASADAPGLDRSAHSADLILVAASGRLRPLKPTYGGRNRAQARWILPKRAE